MLHTAVTLFFIQVQSEEVILLVKDQCIFATLLKYHIMLIVACLLTFLDCDGVNLNVEKLNFTIGENSFVYLFLSYQ